MTVQKPTRPMFNQPQTLAKHEETFDNSIPFIDPPVLCQDCWNDFYDDQVTNILIYLVHGKLPSHIENMNQLRQKYRKINEFKRKSEKHRLIKCKYGQIHVLKKGDLIPMLRFALQLFDEVHLPDHTARYDMGSKLRQAYPLVNEQFFRKYLFSYLQNCQQCKNQLIIHQMPTMKYQKADFFAQLHAINENKGRFLNSYKQKQFAFDMQNCFYDCTNDKYDQFNDDKLNKILYGVYPKYFEQLSYEQNKRRKKILRSFTDKFKAVVCSRNTPHLWRVSKPIKEIKDIKMMINKKLIRRVPMLQERQGIIRLLHDYYGHLSASALAKHIRFSSYDNRSMRDYIYSNGPELCEKCTEDKIKNPIIRMGKQLQPYRTVGTYQKRKPKQKSKKIKKYDDEQSQDQYYTYKEQPNNASDQNGEQQEQQYRQYIPPMYSINTHPGLAQQQENTKYFYNEQQPHEQIQEYFHDDSVSSTIFQLIQSKLCIIKLQQRQIWQRKFTKILLLSQSMKKNYEYYGDNMEFRKITGILEQPWEVYAMIGINKQGCPNVFSIFIAIKPEFHSFYFCFDQFFKECGSPNFHPMSISVQNNETIMQSISTLSYYSRIPSYKQIFSYFNPGLELRRLKQQLTKQQYFKQIIQKLSVALYSGSIESAQSALQTCSKLMVQDYKLQFIIQNSEQLCESKMKRTFTGNIYFQQILNEFVSVLQSTTHSMNISELLTFCAHQLPNLEQSISILQKKVKNSNFMSKKQSKQLQNLLSTKIYNTLVENINQAKGLVYKKTSRISYEILNKGQKFIVSYIVQYDHWQCSCMNQYRVGLPCSHLILVIRENKADLRYYIHGRWIK